VITVQKILFLKNVPLFSGMPPEDLGHLAGIAEEIVYSEGDEIIREGDHGDEMFLIVEGKVGIHRQSESLAVLVDRDYFGEMSILDGEPRSATATAQADCLLLRIRQTDFYGILERHSNVSLTIIHTLTRRLRQMNQGTISDDGSDEGAQ
jgi:CRP-like cAMP-binding protein